MLLQIQVPVNEKKKFSSKKKSLWANKDGICKLPMKYKPITNKQEGRFLQLIETEVSSSVIGGLLL